MRSIFIVIILSFLGLVGHAETANTVTDDIFQLLSDSSSIEERLLGFQKARAVDSVDVNYYLVRLLESGAAGGKVNSLLLLPSWHEALTILALRFPEAGIRGASIGFKREDALMFKHWWSKNAARIKYRDNTHFIVSDAGLDSDEPASPGVPPKQSTLSPKLTPMVHPPTKDPETKPPLPKPNETSASSTPWSIIVMLIVAATGLLWLLLKRRS